MLTFVRNFLQSPEQQRELKQELLEKETQFLDHEVLTEELETEALVSCMKDIIINTVEGEVADNLNTGVGVNKVPGALCTSQKGVITKISSNSGVIDDFTCFDAQAAGTIFADLHPGCVVEYLSYQNDKTNYKKVVKIQNVVEDNWDLGTVKIQDAVEALRKEKRTIFNTQLRSVPGLITARLPSAIYVDTAYNKQEVDLDSVELTFIPKEGDRVILECNVQLDTSYADQAGEILQVLKVLPSLMKIGEKLTVDKVFENITVLSGDAYIFQQDVPPGTQLHLGDIVKADLIECDYNDFVHRAIKIEMLEKNFGEICRQPNTTSLYAVNIVGEERCILTKLWEKKNVTLKIENNLTRTVLLKEIELRKGPDSLISVVEPLGEAKIGAGGQLSVIFEVQSKFFGESKELFTLVFDKFRVKRSFIIIVCESEELAQEAERRLVASAQMNTNGRTVAQRSRYYAHQVWSNKFDVVPGECIATKRRFVPVRLGFYEVPEQLRLLYLTIERRREMLGAIEKQYPCLKEELCMNNYVQRFSLFLHLEEIDYFISFRNYDRDRAHFQRDGQFLSLQIENLAERRPSLVVGDVVHAINIWGAVKPNPKIFEGIVHKVLFDRVLLKFNAGFHEQYNGSDYSLQFHFSRFGFRKQHFSISRIISHMGEKFLFPTKVTKRNNPQLEVSLVDDKDMYIYDTKLDWYNPSLNSIQKRAVYNVLRGETECMPYVIFGPPGTGKTVTLVETILQLVKNLPSARLLVGAPSNSSADLITKRLIESGATTPGSFIRLVSQNQIEKDLIPTELMPYCATVDIGSIGTVHDTMVVTEQGLKLRCQMKFLGIYRVTISTCTTLGNYLQMGFPPGHFSHVLIDEAGQCTEPETIIPIVLLPRNHGQVVLAGDPHQLQAIVINRYAAERGFQVSFLERLLERPPYRKDLQRYPNTSGYNPILLTKLLYNYRSLPSIMSTYSKLFYDNELIPMVSPVDSREVRLLEVLQSVFKPNNRDLPRTHGTIFYGVLGENKQEPDSPSWFNYAEANEVFITAIALYRFNVHPDQIGILTPYIKQVKTLRNMFIASDVKMPKIGSVEEFQGQERDVMLISTVRSTESILRQDRRLCLGFVRCNKRMNVAISRARSLMIIFGNPHLLSVDDCWRQLILFCANNNAYFGCEMPVSLLESNQKTEDSDNEDTFDCVR
ncbi:probable RNA helicase armi [Scaptodrosophila lebanonensis]|uniref:RNA helicase n=1 Tax=Drosophila lebanonensis TaxID=7225 RepID=A0A6J2UCP6_DROLE|nr:probable RNA helicase armi [Scaptodrosophila lebanonensis]